MTIISEIIDSWAWVGLNPVQILAENDFGNLIVEDSDGAYWRLSPEDFYCEVIAHSRSKLDELLNNEEFKRDWNKTALVDQARKALGDLEEGKKYCLVIPSVLGGAYDISNIKIVPLFKLIRFSGHIAKEIHNLPDGQQIELKIID